MSHKNEINASNIYSKSSCFLVLPFYTAMRNGEHVINTKNRNVARAKSIT